MIHPIIKRPVFKHINELPLPISETLTKISEQYCSQKIRSSDRQSFQFFNQEQFGFEQRLLRWHSYEQTKLTLLCQGFY